MKKLIVPVISLLLILSACAAPSAGTNVPSPDVYEAPAPPVVTETPEPLPTDNSLWTKAYVEVLQNNAEFYYTDYKRNMTLAQAIADFDEAAFIKQFTVTDLDSDDVPEILIRVSVSEANDVGYVLLQYYGGAVNSYDFTYRAFASLKADGTFETNGRPSEDIWMYGFGTMRFEDEMHNLDIFASCESSKPDDKGNWTNSYFVNNESATEAEFQTIEAQQEAKPDAVWYEFTDANIEAVLS